MFEKYLDLDGFKDIGSSDVCNATLTLTAGGVFRTYYFFSHFEGYVKSLRFSFNESDGIVCIMAETTDKEEESISSWKVNDLIKEKVVPLIVAHNRELEPGLKWAFRGEVYKKENKAFFDIVHPQFFAVPQKGRRKVEG